MDRNNVTTPSRLGLITHHSSLITLLLAVLLATACSLPAGLSQPAPNATAEATTEATTEASTPPPATAVPDATSVVEPTAASSATPQPTATPRPDPRNALAGRLLYIRGGDLYQWSGTGSQQLTSTGDLAWPRWSPDGQRIAIVQRGDSFSELQLLDQQGQNAVQLTRHQSRFVPGSKDYAMASIWAITPSWEPPGGERLLYSADVEATHMALWIVEAGGGTPRPLRATADFGANIEGVTYAPDGTKIAFSLAYDTPPQLWIVDLDTGIRHAITDGTQSVYDPAWAPDGQALAVALIDGASSGIWLISADGTRRSPLISTPAARAPTWSPDGSQLAFIGEEGGKFNVYVADLTSDGAGGYTAGEPRRLTNDGDIDGPSGLSWAP
jgi:TolB protein